MAIPCIFYDQSVPVSATFPLVQWEWDFDNNGSADASGTNVTELYTTYGPKPVVLEVTDNRGCSNSTLQNVTVHPLPAPDFYVANECLHEPNSFLDNTTIPFGSIVAWEWDFGDQDGATVQNPVHLYQQDGAYQVQLIAESALGCRDSVTKQVRVYPLPVADFISDSVCESSNVYLKDQSTSSYGSVNQWRWAFGDGTGVFNTKHGTHNYAGPGSYMATHIAITEYGCADTIEKPVRIYPDPMAAFTWKKSVCLGDTMHFMDNSSIVQTTPGGDHITDWLWYFEGLDTTTVREPSYAPQTGGFEVTLKVTSNFGCTDQSTGHPVVFPKPVVSISASPGCEGIPLAFKDNSKIVMGQVDKWLWKFGDGDTMQSKDPLKVYVSPGVYVVTLTAWSNQNCMDSTVKQVTVHETPYAHFTLPMDSGCSPFEFVPEDLSAVSTGGLTYKWYLNGEFISEDKKPVITIENDSLHPVGHSLRLTVVSDFGCSATATYDSLGVYPAPIASFLPLVDSMDMFEPVVEFRNHSRYSYRWEWEFGDGTVSEEFSPLHEYLNSGVYDVKLTSFNQYNCQDTAVRTLKITPITTIYIPTSFTPNGDGKNEIFYVHGFNEGQFFRMRIWDRWGQLVYDQEGMENGWDGIMPEKGKAPAGSYAYEIIYKTSEGKKERLHGNLALIR